ncbi:8271_t:CDS:1, partial [Funneliformis geosporum]
CCITDSSVNSDVDGEESETETDKSEVDEKTELEIDIVESEIEELVISDESF